MISNIPFYVREFNAASMAEAIHAADQALRIEGVTVAVWKNFAQSFANDVQRERQKLLESFTTEAEFCIGNQSIARYNDAFQAVQNGANICLPEHFAQITIADQPRGSIPYETQQFSVRKHSFAEPLKYSDLTFLSIIPWQTPSCFVTSWLSYELGYSINEPIHIDGKVENQNIDDSLPFLGHPVRMISNLSGTETEFFSDECGNDLYPLPTGAVSIHKPFDSDRLAWHRAKSCEGKPRVVSVANLEFKACIS